jgi:hypothetical protein
MKNTVLRGVTPCGCCKNRRFGGTLVLTTATGRNIPEDGILHSHRRGNLKSYITLTGGALQRRRNVSPVKYKMGFYIPQDGILLSHRCENLNF